MPRFQFDPKLSLGHIGQILALIVGLTAGYFQLKADAAETRQKMALLESQTNARIDANTARIETQGAMLTQRLDWIGQTLEQLRADLQAARQ